MNEETFKASEFAEQAAPAEEPEDKRFKSMEDIREAIIAATTEKQIEEVLIAAVKWMNENKDNLKYISKLRPRKIVSLKESDPATIKIEVTYEEDGATKKAKVPLGAIGDYIYEPDEIDNLNLPTDDDLDEITNNIQEFNYKLQAGSGLRITAGKYEIQFLKMGYPQGMWVTTKNKYRVHYAVNDTSMEYVDSFDDPYDLRFMVGGDEFIYYFIDENDLPSFGRYTNSPVKIKKGVWPWLSEWSSYVAATGKSVKQYDIVVDLLGKEEPGEESQDQQIKDFADEIVDTELEEREMGKAVSDDQKITSEVAVKTIKKFIAVVQEAVRVYREREKIRKGISEKNFDIRQKPMGNFVMQNFRDGIDDGGVFKRILKKILDGKSVIKVAPPGKEYVDVPIKVKVDDDFLTKWMNVRHNIEKKNLTKKFVDLVKGNMKKEKAPKPAKENIERLLTPLVRNVVRKEWQKRIM
jgi:hypothetical protein